MTTAIKHSLLRWPALKAPAFLRNAVLLKELRSTSRRRQYYLLRLVYVLALGGYATLTWMGLSDWQTGGTFSAARMADVGKRIVYSIVWFQFVASQLIMIVLMSTAISGEIYHRTLGLVLATPISLFQIALGKLLGKLSHVVVLLACGFPLLAMVRVFGGVPWDFLVSSLVICLGSAMLAGVVSMYHSILFRQAWAAIVMSLIYLGTYNLFTGIWAAIFVPLGFVLSPAVAMGLSGDEMLNSVPGNYVRLGVFAAIMVLFSLVMVRRCAQRMKWISYSKALGEEPPRYRAIEPMESLRAMQEMARQAAADSTAERQRWSAEANLSSPEAWPGVRPLPADAGPSDAGPKPYDILFPHVTGSPVYWREKRLALFHNPILRFVTLIMPVSLLLMSYVLALMAGGARSMETHAFYITLYVIVGAAGTCFLSASVISSERQARTLEVLLSTAIPRWRIVADKAFAVIWRCRLVWCLLGAHVCLSVLTGLIHPIAVLHLGLLFVWLNVFLLGSGIFFSTVCRTTTTAVFASAILPVAFWIIAPALLTPGVGVWPDGSLPMDYVTRFLNPAAQAKALTVGSPGFINMPAKQESLAYAWTRWGPSIGWAATTCFELAVFAIYTTIGLTMAWQASIALKRQRRGAS